MHRFCSAGPRVLPPLPGESVFFEDLAEFAADGAVAGLSVVPAGVADLFDDGVDVANHFADDDGGAFGLVLVHDLGQRAYVRVEQAFRGLVQGTVIFELFCLHGGACHFQRLLQELDRVPGFS